MDSNAVAMKQKYKFAQAPTEMGYKDFGIFPNHVLLNMSKNLDDMEQEFKADGDKPKTKKQMMIEVALQQHQDLQERYQAQKSQNIDEIINNAQRLAKGQREDEGQNAV